MPSRDDSPARAYAAPTESVAASSWVHPPLTPADCIHVLEIHGDDRARPVTITAAIASNALEAICTALSEQLDRYAQDRAEHAEDVLTLREHTALVGRLRPLAVAGGHAVVSFAQAELRTCLLELARYVDRVDDEHCQAPELRTRLKTIERVTRVLWEANAAAAQTHHAVDC
jgi:hypothetical protein